MTDPLAQARQQQSLENSQIRMRVPLRRTPAYTFRALGVQSSSTRDFSAFPPVGDVDRKLQVGLSRSVRAIAAFGLIILSNPAVSQALVTTEITCPERTETFVRVDYFYSVDQPSRFTCWYKSPAALAQTPQEFPLSLKTEGKCQLKNADSIADMQGNDSAEFSAGRQTCNGDRNRCIILCRPG